MEAKLRLTIKDSDPQHAVACARARGFCVLVSEEAAPYTRLIVLGTEIAAAEWFCEPPMFAPYPEGTCLLYQTIG